MIGSEKHCFLSGRKEDRPYPDTRSKKHRSNSTMDAQSTASAPKQNNRAASTTTPASTPSAPAEANPRRGRNSPNWASSELLGLVMEIVRQCQHAKDCQESSLAINWSMVQKKLDAEFQVLKNHREVPLDASFRSRESINKKWRDLLKGYHSKVAPTGQSRVLQAHQYLMANGDLVDSYFPPVRATEEDVGVGSVAGVQWINPEHDPAAQILFPDGKPAATQDITDTITHIQDSEDESDTFMIDQDAPSDDIGDDVEAAHVPLPVQPSAGVKIKTEVTSKFRPTLENAAPSPSPRGLRTGQRGQNHTQATRGKINSVISSLSEEVKSSNQIFAALLSKPRMENSGSSDATIMTLLINQLHGLQMEVNTLRNEVHNMQLQMARMPHHNTSQPSFPFNHSFQQISPSPLSSLNMTLPAVSSMSSSSVLGNVTSSSSFCDVSNQD